MNNAEHKRDILKADWPEIFRVIIACNKRDTRVGSVRKLWKCARNDTYKTRTICVIRKISKAACLIGGKESITTAVKHPRLMAPATIHPWVKSNWEGRLISEWVERESNDKIKLLPWNNPCDGMNPQKQEIGSRGSTMEDIELQY